MHSDRLHWTGGWDLEPVWPHEPDVNTIKSLAKRHLVTELPDSFDDTRLEVSFFTEGGFNKLYNISYPDHHTSYLFRVTLPIEPYYKTESEVATIAYLRANTSIPVPQVFAWDSDGSNELHFEWILMAKIDGVPLFDVWRKVPWEKKLELTGTIAAMVKQLHDRKFNGIGGLYFKSAIERKRSKPEIAQASDALQSDSGGDKTTVADCRLGEDKDQHEPKRSTMSNGAGNDDAPGAGASIVSQETLLHDSEKMRPKGCLDQADFCVDRIFDPLFFIASRLYLQGDRGPYISSIEWLSAEIHIQLEWIKNGPVENDPEFSDDFAEESPTMERLCQEYLGILPNVFGGEEAKDSFTLHHSDLNAANILIHPETFEITGIVDWELINVVPEWKATEHPRFLRFMEPEDEEEPPIPSYEDEEDIDVIVRDKWDYRILRRHFDEVWKRLAGDNDIIDDDTMGTKAKRHCHEFVPQLTDTWEWSEKWLRIYQTTGISQNGTDWAKQSPKLGESESESDNGSEEEGEQEEEQDEEEKEEKEDIPILEHRTIL